MAVIPMKVLPHYGRRRRMGLDVFHLRFPHNPQVTPVAQAVGILGVCPLSASPQVSGTNPRYKSADAGYTRT